MPSQLAAPLAALVARPLASPAAATTSRPAPSRRSATRRSPRTSSTSGSTTAVKQPGPGRRPAVVPGPARLHEVRRRQGEAAGAEGPGEARPKPRSRSSASSEYDDAQAQVMQFLIPAEWVAAGGRQAGRQGLRHGGPEDLRGPEEAVLPDRQGLPEVPQDLGHDRGRHALPREARRSSSRSSRRRSPRTPTRSPTPTSRTYYNKNKKRFAQPERRDLRVVLDQDQGEGRRRPRRRSTAARPGRRSPRSTRSTRPRRRRAASCPASPRASRRRRSTTRSSRAKKGEVDGPGQDPVRLLRLQGHEDHAGVAAVARRRPSDTIKNLLQVAAPAEGAGRVRQGLPQGLQGQDELRRGLPRRRVQERARRSDATPVAALGRPQPQARSPQTPQPQPAPQPAPTPQSHAVGGSRAVARASRASRARRGSTRSPAACGASARGTASRTSARSCRTRSRRPTSWPTPRTRGDDAKLLDELGDVLFQVYFLSLLLEERGAGRPGRGGRPLPREADPPPPARVRRRRGRHGRRRGAQLGRDQARGRARRRRSSATCPRPCPSTLYAEEGRSSGASASAGRPAGLAAVELDDSRRAPAGRACARRVEAGRRPRARPAPRPRTDIRATRWRQSLSEIEQVHARQILDSRGNPTVEVEVVLDVGRRRARGGALGRVDRRVRGGRAARRRRRLGRQGRGAGGGERERRARRGACTGIDAADQAALDRAMIELDGTPNKGRLGRERDPRRLAGGRQGGRGRGRACRSGATSAARRRTCCRCR